MRLITVVGYSNSGKTTVIESLVPLLKKKGYSVGTIKNIHCSDYEPDQVGTDTWRHKEAGSDVTVGCGLNSTNIMVQNRIPIQELVAMFNFDYLFLEGVTDLELPRIITARTEREIQPFMAGNTLAVSGVVAENISMYHGLKTFNVLESPELLIDLIINSDLAMKSIS